MDSLTLRGSLSKYLVKHGIEHLFEVGDKNGVRDRLLDLHFLKNSMKRLNGSGSCNIGATLEKRRMLEAYLQVVEEGLSGKVDKTLLDTISAVGIFCKMPTG